MEDKQNNSCLWSNPILGHIPLWFVFPYVGLTGHSEWSWGKSASLHKALLGSQNLQQCQNWFRARPTPGLRGCQRRFLGDQHVYSIHIHTHTTYTYLYIYTHTHLYLYISLSTSLSLYIYKYLHHSTSISISIYLNHPISGYSILDSLNILKCSKFLLKIEKLGLFAFGLTTYIHTLHTYIHTN